MNYFSFIAEYWREYLSGLAVSLELAAAGIVLGLIPAVLLALMSLHHNRIIRYLAIGIIELGRGIPSVIVLYLAYFGLPSAGIVLSAFAAAITGLSFTMAAYSAEVIRAGIKEVPAGQFEAADALSLSGSRKMLLVVLPQAVSKVIPPLIALGIALFQATSLAYAVTAPELLSRAYGIASLTYNWTPAIATAGLVYAIFTISITVALRLAGRARRHRALRLARLTTTH